MVDGNGEKSKEIKKLVDSVKLGYMRPMSVIHRALLTGIQGGGAYEGELGPAIGGKAPGDDCFLKTDDQGGERDL
jgi:hypothetical protein